MPALTTKEEIELKAGKNLSEGTLLGDGHASILISEAEAYVNMASNTNWNKIYGDLTTELKKHLNATAGAVGAMYAVDYNPDGYTTQEQVRDKLNFLWNRVKNGIGLLTDNTRRRKLGKGIGDE